MLPQEQKCDCSIRMVDCSIRVSQSALLQINAKGFVLIARIYLMISGNLRTARSLTTVFTVKYSSGVHYCYHTQNSKT